MNNFDNLFEGNEYDFDPEKHRQIKERVWQTLGTYRLVGQIVDVYLPAMVNVLVEFAGGKTDDALGESSTGPALGKAPDLEPPI
jgi:hypothetical protein